MSTSSRELPRPRTRILFSSACILAVLLFLTPFQPRLSGQEGKPDVVGTVEMVVDGETVVFDVVEGPVTEGFATGYSAQPRGEAIALGASLHGRHRGSDATVTLSVGVWQASMEHMCDPFANQVRVSAGGDEGLSGRLRPGDRVSGTCPPEEGRPDGLRLHLDLAEAELDEETRELSVRGTFSGPLGRGDDAPVVSGGRFEATLRPFEELMGRPAPAF